ncbi:MAG: UDP-diphosphatase [Elusimicrobia bacterium CG08_land_8_20_14_0_20_59_10]|nr:MAG: UDP-diphosphatase [Elusimicrobia bacterium CG08_land_8_20_14_0_20_59_10]
MNEFQAIILGLLQGAGEFLPVSSSAHLALAPQLFGWKDPGLTYDVMLHLGTLLAVVLYFAKDWVEIMRDGLTRPKEPRGRMLWLLAAGTLPAGIAGLLLNDLASSVFRDPRWIAFNLVFFSLFIYLADRKPGQTLTENSFTLKHALLIGLAQTLALMPGASRSGMTLMAALFLGYTRSAAARISFLLSTPIILGAGILEARHISTGQLDAAFAAGIISAFLVGLGAIHLLLTWLKRNTLTPFLAYRVMLGAVIFWMFRN